MTDSLNSTSLWQKKANKHISIDTETRAALAARSERSSHTHYDEKKNGFSIAARKKLKICFSSFPHTFLLSLPFSSPFSLACTGVGRGVVFWLIKLKGRLLFVGKNPIISPREAAEGERLLMALRRARPNGHFRASHNSTTTTSTTSTPSLLFTLPS